MPFIFYENKSSISRCNQTLTCAGRCKHRRAAMPSSSRLCDEWHATCMNQTATLGTPWDVLPYDRFLIRHSWTLGARTWGHGNLPSASNALLWRHVGFHLSGLSLLFPSRKLYFVIVFIHQPTRQLGFLQYILLRLPRRCMAFLGQGLMAFVQEPIDLWGNTLILNLQFRRKSTFKLCKSSLQMKRRMNAVAANWYDAGGAGGAGRGVLAVELTMYIHIWVLAANRWL